MQPDEVIVVGREGDAATEGAVRVLQPEGEGSAVLRWAAVNSPGHIPPVEAGVRMAAGEVVAVVDDDVTVSREWLGEILRPFRNPAVGVVGGRVVVPGQKVGRLKGRPGHVTWYGKTWGNVARLEGEGVLEVDTVMEGNWAWRRELLTSLPMDPVLNFDDASMYGLDLCLRAKASGFAVVYVPRALVLHHAGPRTPELDRADRPARAFSFCRNYTYIMMKHLPWWRRVVFLAWWFGIGESAACGVAAAVHRALSGRGLRFREAERVFAGKIEGIRLWLRGGARSGL